MKELGYLYGELVKIIGGHNPYPCADAFPTKYFTMLYNTTIRMGIPAALEERIALFMDHMDPDDWAKSMDIPVPMTKRQFFMLSQIGWVK